MRESPVARIFSPFILNRKERIFKTLWQSHRDWMTKEVLKENIKRLLGRSS